MSKCYVIKNNDGKYWNEDTPKGCYVDNINEATLFTEDDVEDLVYTKDENLIECTICEGDLEKELEVYKKALELACEDPDNYLDAKLAIKKKMHLDEYFLDKAREEVEKEKKC